MVQPLVQQPGCFGLVPVPVVLGPVLRLVHQQPPHRHVQSQPRDHIREDEAADEADARARLDVAAGLAQPYLHARRQ